MKCDIWLEDGCDQCDAAHDGDWSYPVSMSAAWREAGANLAEFDGKASTDCETILAAAIERMEDDPVKYKSFDSPNGWGTYYTLVPALRALLEMIRSCPHATVRVRG